LGAVILVFGDLRLLVAALSKGFFVWVWGFSISHVLVCVFGCFFGLGFVLVAI
jgi:hypothetical protein